MDKRGVGSTSAEIVVAMGAPELATGAPEASGSSARDATLAEEEGVPKMVCRTRGCHGKSAAAAALTDEDNDAGKAADGPLASNESKRAVGPSLPHELKAQVMNLMAKGMFEKASGVALVMLEGYKEMGDEMA